MTEPAQTSIFRERGGWWVVGQSALMLALVPGAMLTSGQWQGWWSLVAGGLLLVLGAVFGLAGVRALGPNLTAYPRPLEDSALIDQGVYGRVRHPLYTSVMLCGFGWALIWRSGPGLALAGALALFLNAKARREEAWLARKFSRYAAYQQQVPRFIPRWPGKRR